MHEPQRLVAEFHRALNIPVGLTPAIRRPELRARLILEEAGETATALLGREVVFMIGAAPKPIASKISPIIDVLDGLCDLAVVTYGCAVEMGIDLAPFFSEVHRSNMAKVNGPIREDGKVLKPPGWLPPDLATVFKQQYGEE